MPPDVPSLDPEPIPVALAPDVRIGLMLDVSSASIGGGGPLRIVDPDEGLLTELPAEGIVTVSRRGPSVALRGAIPDLVRRRLVIEPGTSDGTVRVGNREYRGALELEPSGGGIRVINRVSLEEYLIGVVGAEMGNRPIEEFEALKAQAVASRTYALRQQRNVGARGYDMVADVNSQVYAGLALEQPLAARAVEETRGEVLTWEGEPIDAFFSSTCGGDTEDGPSAFAGAVRPYLRSISDRDETGTAWCAISPRYRWEEQWSATQLTAVLRRTLAANGLPVARANDLTEMRVLDRTGTGRIAALELSGRNGRTTVRGQAIRRVLAPPGGAMLRSTDFTVKLSRRGGRIERLTIEGQGYGHAVGMCQYGAIGRARAGQDYVTILTSYFQGTTLSRFY
jgi:stage II sporulation protein D